MLDRDRVNGIFLTAAALYLATSFVQLHARQPTWHAVDGPSLATVGSAIKRGFVEAARLQGEQGSVFAAGD